MIRESVNTLPNSACVLSLGAAHLDLVPVMEGRSRLDLGIKGALHPDAPIDTPSNWALRVQGKAEQPLPNYQLYNAASDQPERKKDEGKLEKAAQVSGVAKHECRAVCSVSCHQR